jgi:hypothetical protein
MRHWLSYFRRPVVSPVLKAPASRRPLYAGIILAIWLSLALYVHTLGVPFLQEDSTHIRWLSWHTILEPFVTARGAPDYRPLGKSLIKLWYVLLGEHDRIWLRYNNIIFNAFNIAFVGLLASWADTSKRRYWTAAFAALLFSAFPFAYQAIPWINNFFYPLANLLLLAMTAVYWQARVRNSNRLLALAFLFLFLAPFEIEYGLMGSGLLALVELVLWAQKRQPYPWLTGPLLGLALNLLFLARSLTIPKQSYGFGLPTPGRLLLISTYFLQGLMYPISPLAIWIMTITGWGDVAAIWFVSLPVLAGMTAVLWRQGQHSLLLFSLGWFALLNLPALVFVDFDYVVNSPRLLYPPGVGIVIFWGAFLSILALGERRTVLRAAAAGAALLLILGFSVRFVSERNTQYLLAQTPVLQLAEIARQTPADQELLIVNFPSWLAPQERDFAMGNHGVQIIPFYINIQELIYAHNDSDHPARAVQFGNIRRPQPYYYGMLGDHVDYDGLRDTIGRGDDVYLTEWSSDRITLRAVGRVTPTSEPSPLTTYTFGDQVTLALSDYELKREQLLLDLRWQLSAPVEQDVTVFTHLYSPDGVLLDQADGYPIGGLAPFWLWPAGQSLTDRRLLTFPADTPGGTYRVGIGLYDAATGERLPVYDQEGVRLVDDVAPVLVIEKPD